MYLLDIFLKAFSRHKFSTYINTSSLYKIYKHYILYISTKSAREVKITFLKDIKKLISLNFD